MKNEIRFEPGDKVMRVDRTNHGVKAKPAPVEAQWGVVYCVEACWPSPRGDVYLMRLSGFPRVFHKSGTEVGFICPNFRKVEEIRLCVEAAKKVKKREPVAAE